MMIKKLFRPKKYSIIDCHTHVLNGVDDGSKDINQTEQLIESLVSQGIKKIFLTPHVQLSDNIDKKKVILNEKLAELKQLEIVKEVELFLGCELMGSESLLKLENFDPYKIDGTNLLMMEAPVADRLDWTVDLAYEMDINNTTMLMAHVERYLYFKQNTDVLWDLKNQGALLQVNASSINGEMGVKTKRWVKHLIDENLVDCIGSDCHRPDWRAPEWEKTIKILNSWCKPDIINKLVYENILKYVESKPMEKCYEL